MIVSKFDMKDFLRRPDSLAANVPSEEIFGLLKRSFDLPAAWAALLKGEAGDHTVIPAGGEISADGVEEVLLARATPFEILFEESELPASDGFQCRTEVHLRFALILERSELRSFQQAVVGSHRAVSTAALARLLQPTIRAALLRSASRQSAADLVDGSMLPALSTAVSDALQPILFQAGLSLESSPVIRIESAALQDVRRDAERAAVARKEHEAAQQVQEAIQLAQREHLDRLGDLLIRLRDLAAASPEAGLPDLIRTFEQRHRGEIYEALFASHQPKERTRWIIVAAAEEMLFFDPANASQPARRVPVSGAAGPMRSVRPWIDPSGEILLLLGASRGVYRWPLDSQEPDAVFLVPGAPQVKGGFNAVAAHDDRLWATHSELGVHEWCASRPHAGRTLFLTMTKNASAVRHVQLFENQLFCSVDENVIAWPIEDEQADDPSCVLLGATSIITAMQATDFGVFAGTSEGDVLYWPVGMKTAPRRLVTGRGRPVESVHLLNQQGVRRLMYADTSPHLHALVLGDSFACRFEAGGQTLRRVIVADDLVVALTELRDRLLLFSPAQPERPRDVIHVAALRGRSVQDVCLIA